MSACEGHFAELIEDRCCRRVDKGVEDRDRQHGSIAFRNLSEDRNLGFVEIGERNDEELFDLVGVGAEWLAGLCPADDGRHSKARTRREVIELAEYVCWSQPEPDLFVGFADRGLDDRFVPVESAARKRELAGVVSESRRAARDEETGLVVFVCCNDQSDGGRA